MFEILGQDAASKSTAMSLSLSPSPPPLPSPTSTSEKVKTSKKRHSKKGPSTPAKRLKNVAGTPKSKKSTERQVCDKFYVLLLHAQFVECSVVGINLLWLLHMYWSCNGKVGRSPKHKKATEPEVSDIFYSPVKVPCVYWSCNVKVGRSPKRKKATEAEVSDIVYSPAKVPCVFVFTFWV